MNDNNVAQPAAGVEVREATRRILGLREGDYCYARTCFKKMGHSCSGCEDFDAIADRVAQELGPKTRTPADVQERARRAVRQLLEKDMLWYDTSADDVNQDQYSQQVADIIAAEFSE